jgi:uncharacterized protein (TIGR03067 family)
MFVARDTHIRLTTREAIMRKLHQKTLTIVIGSVVAAGMISLPTRAAEPSQQQQQALPPPPLDKADLAQLQGFWERKTGEDVPGLVRATKEIRGTHETITYYGQGDKVLRAHEVDLTVGRRDGVRIFTYSNWTATEGPDKGHKSPAPVSYIYRADENTIVEVWGFLPGQELRPPQVAMWVRKLPLTAAAAAQQQALAGKWIATPAAAGSGGAAVPAASTEKPTAGAQGAADAPGDEMTFNADDFIVRKGGQVVLSGVIRLNPAVTPKAIDLIITQSPNGLKTGQVIRGIYEIKDLSTLRWCSGAPNQPRPHDFTVREGGSQSAAELRRAESSR